MADTPFLYDVVSYPGHVRPQLHPARLAAIARLHDIPAALPSRCRYLEVGCGDGASLLPVALSYPDAQVVGIDLAQEAITRGESFRSRLGLMNLTLAVADLTTWQPPVEQFDYIIAHGFYSWVPPFVRDSLFELCRQRLAPHGVVYISYNALPGCHVRRMVWEMLRFHVRDITEPAKRIEQATAFLQFLGAGALGRDADLLKREATSLLQSTHPSVLFHDDLADINEPVSIIDFAAHAGHYGLQFLAEADYFEMTADLLPQGAGKMLTELAEKNLLLKEQYLDYLKVRRFRQTLLCRAETIRAKKPDPEAVRSLSITCQAEPHPNPPTLTPGEKVQFKSPGGANASFDHVFVNAAYLILTESFPNSWTFDELAREAHRRLNQAYLEHDGEFRSFLARVFVEGYRVGLVDLLAEPPRFAREAGKTPLASPLARLQLEDGLEVLTSLRPSIIQMDSPISREMLQLLDGTRTRTAMLNDLAERAAANPKCRRPEDPPQPATWWKEKLAPHLEQGLAMAARNGLLMER